MDAGERPRRQPARQRQPAATAALQRQPLPRGKAWISVTSPWPHPRAALFAALYRNLVALQQPVASSESRSARTGLCVGILDRSGPLLISQKLCCYKAVPPMAEISFLILGTSLWVVLAEPSPLRAACCSALKRLKIMSRIQFLPVIILMLDQKYAALQHLYSAGHA